MKIRSFLGISSLVLLLGLRSAWAQPERQVEHYSSRPSIQCVASVSHSDLFEKSWPTLKQAQLEFVAQVLGLYPSDEIYFLARDSELFFDLSVLLMGVEDRTQLSRLHLVNVSRSHLGAPFLFDYLEQEGVSYEGLRSGKRYLFVDTGFTGSIPRKILKQFTSHLGPEVGAQFHCHFVSSMNPRIPSSRIFLATLSPASVGHDPGWMRNTVLEYEYLHRFNFRSTEYDWVDERWEPAAPRTDQVENDGKVSRPEALRYMEDLKAYSELESTRALFRARLHLWQQLREAAENSEQSELVALLKALLVRQDLPGEAIVRDFLEWQGKVLSIFIELDELGLMPEHSMGPSSNKRQLILKCPHWRSILEDPIIEVPKIVENGDFLNLNRILDVLDDVQIQKIIFRALAGPFPTEEIKFEARKSLLARIDLDKGKEREWIALETFSQASSVDLGQVLNRLIDEGDSQVWSILVLNAFKKPHSIAWKSELNLLLEVAEPVHLIQIFCHPHSKDWGDELATLTERCDLKILDFIWRRVLSRPHSIDWGVGVFLLVEERIKKLR